MLESRLSVAAAAHLAAGQKIVTRADLDGPSLCAIDPYAGGPEFEGAVIRMTDDAVWASGASPVNSGTEFVPNCLWAESLIERTWNRMKRTTRLIALIVALLLALPMAALAEGSPVVYRELYASEVDTLNYLYTTTTNNLTIPANVVDTLIEYDRYGVLQPSLAESWSTMRTTPSGRSTSARA